MDNLKDITKGKALVVDQRADGTHLKGFRVIVVGGGHAEAYVSPQLAELYCEAHNVAQATGLSPEQMKEGLDDAVEVMEVMSKSLATYGPHPIIENMHKVLLSKLNK